MLSPTFDDAVVIDYDRNAGWSSLVARWAHNPKVGGSNPPPATNAIIRLRAIGHLSKTVQRELAHSSPHLLNGRKLDSGLEIKHYPRWRMVARVFLSTCPSV